MLLAMFVFCFIACIAFRTNVANAASPKASVTLEFTDGTQKKWNGKTKINTKKKKLAYVYFGNTISSEVTDATLIEQLDNTKFDNSGYTTVSGNTYYRKADGYYDYELDEDIFLGYTYYSNKPIKWRVLSYSKKNTFLVSENILSSNYLYGGFYDENGNKYVYSWEKSSIRDWLNGEFYTSSFNTAEQNLIKTTKVKNKNNPIYGTSGGKTTKDKIFLLSYEDVVNTKYGFNAQDQAYDVNRRASEVYADNNYNIDWNATKDYKNASTWWLRTPGYNTKNVMRVQDTGIIHLEGVDCGNYQGIRPALYVNLSSVVK